MRSINSRLETLEDALIKDEDGIYVIKEWLLCITGGIPMPLPMISYLNVSLEQRLENINCVEVNMKERGYYEGEESDGVFANEEDSALFYESFMTSDNINATEESIQKRVLRYFCRSGFFDKESTEKMLASENSGFSLNADVRIQSWDREGLERLIRYCARPCFKSENLRWNGLWLRYQFPKPTHKGKTFIQLEPVEFIEKISKLIPYPRRHRRHYHGVFAPNSPLRAKISANAKKCSKSSISPDVEKSAEKAKGVSFSWAKLIARIYEVNPLICECGKEIKIVAFITHPAEIQRILLGIGWSVKIPDFDPPCDFDDLEICQLIPGTDDGFPDEVTFYGESGPDPPSFENFIDREPSNIVRNKNSEMCFSEIESYAVF